MPGSAGRKARKTYKHTHPPSGSKSVYSASRGSVRQQAYVDNLLPASLLSRQTSLFMLNIQTNLLIAPSSLPARPDQPDNAIRLINLSPPNAAQVSYAAHRAAPRKGGTRGLLYMFISGFPTLHPIQKLYKILENSRNVEKA